MVRCKFYIRKLPKPIAGYKYELFGGIPGGKFHSAIFKTRKEAERMKKYWLADCKKHPYAFRWRDPKFYPEKN